MVFDEAKCFTETHGFDTPPYEHHTGCPFCGGAYIPVKYCDCCRHEVTNDYVQTDDGHIYCENCYSLRNIADDL